MNGMFAVAESRARTESQQSAEDTAARILDAAAELFLEFGYRRTSIETIARRLGVSRVTIYNHYTDKSALLQAVLYREIQQASADITKRLNELSVEENPVVEGFARAVILAQRHPLLRRLLDTEPDWLVLHLTLQGGALLQLGTASASAFLHQPRFREWLREPDLDLAAELFVRLLVSAIITPGSILGSGDEEQLRRAARYLVQPLLRDPPK